MEMSMTLKKESEGEAENDVTAKSQASAALMASGTHSFLTAMLGESPPGVMSFTLCRLTCYIVCSSTKANRIAPVNISGHQQYGLIGHSLTVEVSCLGMFDLFGYFQNLVTPPCMGTASRLRNDTPLCSPTD